MLQRSIHRLARTARRHQASRGWEKGAGLEDRDAASTHTPGLADLVLDGEPGSGKCRVGQPRGRFRIIDAADEMVDRRLLTAVPVLDQIPGRAWGFHRFLQRDWARQS